ncbi:MAG: methionyl-tRNA formyltransferase [Pseudomonadales bacterium]
MKKDARIGFAGTPPFAKSILSALVAADYRPCVVYSQPDRPSGRGRKLLPSPVKALANTLDIPVETPRSLRNEAQQQLFVEHELDLFIVAAYGLILPQAILDAPRFGCLNVHASLLPRWRGAAPIERAIMAGDSETGVALMQMDAGLDTGPVHRLVPMPIDGRTTGGSLEAALAQLGATALLELLPQFETSLPTVQATQGVTYADKLQPADSLIDWQHSAASIDRQVRALSERQPARTALGDLQIQILAAEASDEPTPTLPAGGILQLHKKGLLIATGDGTLKVTLAQLNRGKGQPLTAADLANGYAKVLKTGAILDSALPE